MADFCYDCTIELFGEELAEKNDFQGIADEDHVIAGLCEGCGGGWFDRDGKRVEETAN